MPLAQGIHEPFRRLEFLLHEGRCILLGPFGRVGRLHQDVRISVVHLHLRHRKPRHSEYKFAVLHIQHEVRNHLASVVVIGICNLSSRGGVEFQDTGHRCLEPLRSHSGLRHYAVEVLFGEFLEIGTYDALGILDDRSGSQSIQLYEQALPKVPCTHTSRLKTLDYLYHLLHLFLIRVDAGPECHFIHKAVIGAAQIAVIVYTVYYIIGHLVLVLAQASELQLLGEVLREGLLHGESLPARTLIVFAVVVRTQTVGRNRVVLLVVRKGNLPGIFGPLLRVILLKHRIFLNLLAHSLLQTLNRQFYQLRSHYLLRRQFLNLFLFKRLFQHRLQILKLNKRPQNLHGVCYVGTLGIRCRIIDLFLDEQGPRKFVPELDQQGHSLGPGPEIPGSDLEIGVCIGPVNRYTGPGFLEFFQDGFRIRPRSLAVVEIDPDAIAADAPCGIGHQLGIQGSFHRRGLTDAHIHGVTCRAAWQNIPYFLAHQSRINGGDRSVNYRIYEFIAFGDSAQRKRISRIGTGLGKACNQGEQNSYDDSIFHSQTWFLT